MGGTWVESKDGDIEFRKKIFPDSSLLYFPNNLIYRFPVCILVMARLQKKIMMLKFNDK